MTSDFFSKATLCLAAVTALAVGIGILTDPVAFNASAGITVNPDAGLLNELRGAGGVILGIGLTAGIGVFFQKLRHAALICAVAGFGGYGLGRVLGFLIAGVPNQSLVWITGLEIVISLACSAAIVRQTRQPHA